MVEQKVLQRSSAGFLLMFEDSGFDKCVFDKLQCSAEPWSGVTFCVVICFVCSVQGKNQGSGAKTSFVGISVWHKKNKTKNSEMVLPSKINPTAVSNSTTHGPRGMRNVSLFLLAEVTQQPTKLWNISEWNWKEQRRNNFTVWQIAALQTY